jgi:ABC-type transporter Mla MlaB component
MRKRSPSAPVARTRRAPAADRGRLRLPSQCTLATADGLRGHLTEALRNVKPVTLDARSVERVDAAGMQLLAAFVRDRAAHGLSVHIEQPSSALLEAQRLLGLERLFTEAVRPTPRAEGR